MPVPTKTVLVVDNTPAVPKMEVISKGALSYRDSRGSRSRSHGPDKRPPKGTLPVRPQMSATDLARLYMNRSIGFVAYKQAIMARHVAEETKNVMDFYEAQS